MKYFPNGYLNATANLTGESPFWILKISAGGTVYYLSDRAETVPGLGTTKAWVKSWGKITEGLSSGRLDEILQADMDITGLIDPDANPNLEDLVTGYELEESEAVLYLWFRGLESPDLPQVMLRGYIDVIGIPDETTVNLSLTDGTCRLERYIGTKVTRAEFPEADEDDIGTVIPIPYGTVKKSPTRAVLSGAMTNIPSNLNATDSVFSVSDSTGLVAGDAVQVDDEQMYINAVSGDQLTVTRGYNDTVAEIHTKGAVVWELREWFNYLVSDVPVDAITKAYGLIGDIELDISAIAVGYTGQAGDEHPAYPGRAVLSLPGYVTITQAVNLLVNDGISLSDSLSLLDSIGVSDMLTILNSLGINDTTTLNDTIAISDLLSVVNTLDASDLIGVSDTITISDAISILESIGVSNGTLSVSDLIGLSDGISVTDATHEHTGATVTISLTPDDIYLQPNTWYISSDNVIDGNLNSGGIMYKYSSYEITRFSFVQPAGYSGTPVRYRWAVRYGGDGDSNFNKSFNIYYGNQYAANYTAGSSTKTTKYQTWQTLNSWSDIVGLWVGVRGRDDGDFRIWEVWLEVEYTTDTSTASANISKSGTVTKTGSASLAGAVSKSGTVSKSGSVSRTGSVSKTGSVSLSGNVTRDGSISKTGTVSESGSVDLSGDVDRSGSISKTGTVSLGGSVIKTGTVTLSGNSTANTLVGDVVVVDVVRQVSISDQFSELLSICGFGPLAIAGTLPPGYALNGVISEYKRAIDWLTSWAFQLRSWFRMAPGGPRLLVRPDNLVPVKSIPAIRLKSDGRRVLRREKVARASIVNTINVLYNRDWTSSGESAYRGSVSGVDQGSVETYGAMEEPSLFMFDFVTGDDMAASLCAFYLAFYASRRWLHTFDVYLDHSELEFGDVVKLDFLAGQVGTITEAGFSPGDIDNCDTMALTVIV